jgi:DNA-directed RNA polymerase subunit alpha
MNQDQSRTLTQIVETISGVKLHDKKGGKFYFKFFLNQKAAETPIEALDLGVRAYNSLKRAGYSNIGDLVEAIASGTEISKIRNCGTKSCKEIMEHLFLYQYESLPVEKRESYLQSVVALNASKKGA